MTSLFILLKNKRTTGIIFCIVLFAVYLPLVTKINFMQNDDWYYYSQVENFLHGNFKLLPQIAPTFYLQGAIASVFSLVFSLNNIPFLTLAIAMLNIFIFYSILTDILERSNLTSLILSTILFFNPLFQYSLIGFMTEQYFLLFLLSSLYFFLKYEKVHSFKDLIISNLFVLFGFFVRQVSLVFSATSVLYFLVYRKWKAALYQSCFSLFLIILYLLLPKTSEMISKTYHILHLLDLKFI